MAHLNGVKIIGAVMSPVFQNEFTTQFELLFKKEAGIFPYADKLVKVADHYGFDGWFFNIEEFLPKNIKWKDVQEFMIYLRKKRSWKSVLARRNSGFMT